MCAACFVCDVLGDVVSYVVSVCFPERTCSVGCTVEESNRQGNMYDA